MASAAPSTAASLPEEAETTAPSVVACRGLSKLYKIYRRPLDVLREKLTRRKLHEDLWALRDVSFEVTRGEVVGIIGRNGAGKSTLLKLLAGTLDKTEGDLTVNGKVSAILELGTGFHPDYSGRDNIKMGGLCLGLTEREIREKTDEIIGFSELEEVIDRPFKTYSSGMQARLTFATAMCVDPDVFIVDEALAAGDIYFTEKCFRRVAEICASGATVLLVTHSLYAVYDACSRCLLLENGELRADGSPREVGGIYERMVWAEKSYGKSLQLSAEAPVTVAAPEQPTEAPATAAVPELSGGPDSDAEPDARVADAEPEVVRAAPAPPADVDEIEPELPGGVAEPSGAGTDAEPQSSAADAGWAEPPEPAAPVEPHDDEGVEPSDAVAPGAGRVDTLPAQMVEMRITTLDDIPVTTMIIDSEYKVVIKVRFNEDVPEPNVGFVLQRHTGLVVTGDTSYEKGVRISGKKGTMATVSFVFICRLLSGAYLLGGGITSLRSSGDYRSIQVLRGVVAVNVEGKRLNGLVDADAVVRVEHAPVGPS